MATLTTVPRDVNSDDSGDSDTEYPNVCPMFSGALPFGMFILNSTTTIRVQASATNSSVPNKLFAKDIWYGAVLMAEWLRDHPELVAKKTVIELAAAAALPSIVAHKLEASYVVATDYPNDELIANINQQFTMNDITTLSSTANATATAAALPHMWGDIKNIRTLLELTPQSLGYDVVLLAEFLWWDTHCQHDNILRSCDALLSQDGVIYASYSHHNPGREALDLEFFQRAVRDYNFEVEDVQSDLKGYNSVFDEDCQQECFLKRLVRRAVVDDSKDIEQASVPSQKNTENEAY